MKKMVLKHKIAYLCSISLLLVATSCSSDDDDDDTGNWIERSVFDGSPRSGATSFTISNIGYMGVGYDGDDYLNSFWAYDIEGN